jgi:hypothetical protein
MDATGSPDEAFSIVQFEGLCGSRARWRDALVRLDPLLDIFFSPVSLGQGFWLPKLAEGIRAADAFLLLMAQSGPGPWQEMEYFEALDRRVKDGALRPGAGDRRRRQCTGIAVPAPAQLGRDRPAFEDDAGPQGVGGAAR